MPDVYRRSTEFRGEVPLGVREFFDMSGAPLGEGELIQRSRDRYDAVVNGNVYPVRLIRAPVNGWTVYHE